MSNKTSEKFHSKHADKSYLCSGLLLSDKRLSYRPFIIVMLACLLFLYFILSNNTLETKINNVEIIKRSSIKMRLFKKNINLKNFSINSKIPEKVTDFIRLVDLMPVDINKNDTKEIFLYEITNSDEESQKVHFFLEEAKELIKRKRLMTPRGGSAFDKVEAVLAIDSKNKEAVQIIYKIIDNYVDLANIAIAEKNDYKVAGFIQNAYIVGESYIDMSPILIKYKKYINDENVFIQSSLTIVEDNSKPLLDEKLTSKRTIENVDLDFSKAASLLIALDNMTGAKAILLRFVEISTYWGRSYDQLLSLYLQQGEFDAAQKLINSNPDLDIYQLAEKVSSLFVANHDYTNALALLESHSPNINDYTEYYALQTGLLYTLGNYKRAEINYRRLLGINYQEPRYWLGLSLSLDAIHSPKALNSYIFTREYSANDSEINLFAQQRIFALSES